MVRKVRSQRRVHVDLVAGESGRRQRRVDTRLLHSHNPIGHSRGTAFTLSFATVVPLGALLRGYFVGRSLMGRGLKAVLARMFWGDSRLEAE